MKKKENDFVINFDDYCLCKSQYCSIFYPMMKVYANILLNNYRKHINDELKVQKAEKSAKKRQLKEINAYKTCDTNENGNLAGLKEIVNC